MPSKYRSSPSARRRAPAQVGQPAVQANPSMAVPPLQWWRRLPADTFTADHLNVLRRAFSGIGMVGEPRWADAVHGHPAAAVGVALCVLKKRRPLTPIIDLTMSTVLVAAIAGDPAAITVLVTMIERMGREAEKERLKRSWLRRQHKHARSRVTVTRTRARIASGA